MIDIFLHKPEVKKNKILLSWSPNYLFKRSFYYIEYLDVEKIDSSEELLTEAYLPICLVFISLGKVRIHLPTKISSETLSQWNNIFTSTAKALYKYRSGWEIINFHSDNDVNNKASSYCGDKTALLFGGGAESLLSLSYLLDTGIKPYLVSVWGNNWSGSELAVNKYRYDLESKIVEKLNLRILRINTDFRDIVDDSNIYPFLQNKMNIVNAALFLPLNLSFISPVCVQFGLREIVSGNEKENSYDLGYYSLSSEMTNNLERFCSKVTYKSLLENLNKVNVIKELHFKYPSISKYQYSCWRSKAERWCLKCEKCLRNYIIFKIHNINPLNVGMDEEIIKKNLLLLVWKARREIVTNKAVKKEWDTIRLVSLENRNQFVSNVINRIYSKLLLSKISCLINN